MKTPYVKDLEFSTVMDSVEGMAKKLTEKV